MQAQCREIRDACLRMFTMMGSQLTFTYVALVSFICHMYIFCSATYLAVSLLTGVPGAVWVGLLSDCPDNTC